ncbi:MAG: FtsX-like permease family protein [Anaerolineae bacterium]
MALWRVGWRYLLRHPWQSVLMVLGITLGVAVVVAIDLANTSASRAFDLSVDSIAGRATHQVVGPPQGFDESVYAALRAQGVIREAAPVVSEYVTVPGLDGRTLQLLGVDPFAEAPFRDYLVGDEGVPVDQLTAFLTGPGAALISTDLATRYGLDVGDTLALDVMGQPHEVVLAGLLEPGDDLSRRALDGLILVDIATAQELTGRVGILNRVDLIIPEGDTALLERVSAALPDTVRVIEVGARAGSVEQMTRAFRTNLLALSLLALVVGMFLIYNTMTFSVVQRRPLFGTLRALGVTRAEVFLMVVSEALIVGVIGAALGSALGVLLGQGAVGLVTRTINDLFFVLTVRGVAVPPESLIKGILLGVAATVATAAPPAWEAASVPPRAALSRSGLESKAQQAVKGLALTGLAAGAVGAVMLLLPLPGLAVSFIGTFLVIIGFAMLTPLAMKGLMRLAMPLTSRLWGALGRMAPRDVVNALSRTSVAVAALMVAVSVTIGISLMVSSFRHTVVLWLEQTLQGDVYISVPGGTAVSPSGLIEPEVIDVMRGWPGVLSVATVRATDIDSPVGTVHLVAVDDPEGADRRLYLAADGTPEEVWARVEAGEAVIVSEPYARRYNLPRRGGQVTLYTGQGERAFPVAGIYYDYGRVQGSVIIDQGVYHDLWGDPGITAVSLELAEGWDPETVSQELEQALAPVQSLLIRPNQALRDEVLVVFDQTFAITGALNLLATLVAFVGVLSALLSLQLEKRRQIGILRAVGLTVRQMWGMVILETGLMGLVAGLMAMPTGFALSLILVYIINRRSFGWTLQMQVAPEPFIQALLVAVVAALLAGIYPAHRMSRTITAEAIRFE